MVINKMLEIIPPGSIWLSIVFFRLYFTSLLFFFAFCSSTSDQSVQTAEATHGHQHDQPPLPYYTYQFVEKNLPVSQKNFITQYGWEMEIQAQLSQKDLHTLEWDWDNDGKADLVQTEMTPIIKPADFLGTQKYTVYARDEHQCIEVQNWNIEVIPSTVVDHHVLVEMITTNPTDACDQAIRFLGDSIASNTTGVPIYWMLIHVDDAWANPYSISYAQWLGYSGVPTVYIDESLHFDGVLKDQTALYSDGLRVRLQHDPRIHIDYSCMEYGTLVELSLFVTAVKGPPQDWIARWALVQPDEASTQGYTIIQFLRDETIATLHPLRTVRLEKMIDPTKIVANTIPTILIVWLVTYTEKTIENSLIIRFKE